MCVFSRFTMVSKVHLLLILIHSSPNLALIQKDNYYEACWEQCYQSIQSIFAPSELKAYEVEAARFLDIGTYARYLKNTESVNGTAILLDYTYSKWHDPNINSMLQPHEDVSSHYSKSQISVQKFNFDIPQHFHKIFLSNFFDNFPREIKVVKS